MTAHRHVLSLAMFFGSFSWSFVLVSLPFHIQAISTLDAAATLTWTGWILGVSSLVTVVTTPFWGRFADRRDTKTLFVMAQFLQGAAFFGMAAARTLPELFLVRCILGVMGASSTFAFVGAGRSNDAAAARREVASLQSAMTIGQVIGPLVGAITAARLGFRPSFVLGGVILVGCGALVHWGLPTVTAPLREQVNPRHAPVGEVIAVSVVVLIGSMQIFFLTAVLPQILPPLGVSEARTLEVGGMIMFVSGVAAAAGSLAAPRLGELRRPGRVLGVLLGLSSLFVAGLSVASSVWAYGILRFLQVLCIAPVFPLVVAPITQRAGGTAIGFINSARIGAAFVGPVIATTVLSWSPAPVLYVLLAVIGIATVPLARQRGRAAPRSLA